MMSLPTESFFAQLPELRQFEAVADPQHYVAAPSSWVVVITDVRGSTRAIEAGRYKDVNALGVASIVAVKNAMPDVELPFVFGGDGATVLVPEARRDVLEASLRGVRDMADAAFGLDLRTGIVPIGALQAAGHEVLVARYRLSSDAVLAMFAGGGIPAAERWIKDDRSPNPHVVSAAGPSEADFEGFQCRWQPIPSRNGHILSLIIQAVDPDTAPRTRTYGAVLRHVAAVIGSDEAVRPVGVDRLRLARLTDGYDQEARVLSHRAAGVRTGVARWRARAMTLLGRWLVRSGRTAGGFDGATYRAQVVSNTDYRKFDATLRMVIDVTTPQRDAVLGYLEERQAAGRLAYGVHESQSALITCMIGEYQGDHLHFVDGADGGYALAAKQLKMRLAA